MFDAIKDIKKCKYIQPCSREYKNIKIYYTHIYIFRTNVHISSPP